MKPAGWMPERKVRILATLDRSPWQTAVSIADAVGHAETSASVAGVLRRLVERGLIRTRLKSATTREYALTGAGKTALDDAVQAAAGSAT